jgi:RNA 2',3'-cyclic 3'-phosphodiesterase
LNVYFQSVRVFVAVDVSEEVREQAARRIEFLRSRFPDLRVGWDKPEKLHLTLKFLGEIDENQLQNLITATEKAVQNTSQFNLTVENTGVFPPKGRARVLWLDVTNGKEHLLELNKWLEDECFAVGFERTEQQFTPHLTIARLREPHKSAELVKLHIATQFPAKTYKVNEVKIIKSELSPHGSRYTVIKQVKLPTDEHG